jgi:hypothetical protein
MSSQVGTMDKLDPHGIGLYLSPAGALVGLWTGLVAVASGVAVLFGAVAAVLAVAYYVVTIWEKPTVQNYINNRAAKKQARLVAALEAQQSEIVGKLKQLGVLTHATTDVSQGETRKTTTTVETTTPKIPPDDPNDEDK